MLKSLGFGGGIMAETVLGFSTNGEKVSAVGVLSSRVNDCILLTIHTLLLVFALKYSLSKICKYYKLRKILHTKIRVFKCHKQVNIVNI